MFMIKITRILMGYIPVEVGVLIITKVINNSRIGINTCMINNGKLKVITLKSIIIVILKAMKRKSITAKHNMRMITVGEVLIITIIKTATIKSIRLNM